MIGKLLKKIFGDKKLNEYKQFLPLVENINKHYESLNKLSDEEIKNRIQEIKQDIQNTINPYFTDLKQLETEYHKSTSDTEKDKISNKIDKQKEEIKKITQKILDENLVEVFAIVKDTCRRIVGHEYLVRGNPETWFMVPFDVQLIGGIALHKGMIAEMATGEGKTLVATLPLFLNALVGRGVHLITVNDYLAQRDSEWMKPIFEFHGITVGVITNDMQPQERQSQYACDITYGTNSEFGFDYLRDNMATSAENLVQGDLYYCIVDEVDSVLIDEARTPLIISGAVKESKNFYKELKPYIQKLVSKQKFLVQKFVAEINQEIKDNDSPDWDKVGRYLLLIKRAAPKSKAFRNYMKDTEMKKLVDKIEGLYLSQKKMHEIDEELFYVIEEKQNSAELSDKGREVFSEYEEDLFVVQQLDEILHEIDNKDITFEEKQNEKEYVTNRYMDKSEKLHNISQLLKSYSLFEKDVDYVVMDNKVMIVDEFTGRLMPGRRFSDGLHQALEAKEGVKIEEASQTLATITIQNYFRMYDKLAGMTGTAVTEENEFIEIYNLPVMVIPTNVPIARADHEDLIYKTKKAKYNAIIKEIKYWHELNKPVLVGTVTVEVSELLSRLLKNEKIKHNVLNAKYHEQEAEIIKNAGQPGAVTIATNMAGRGTDIKLGETVVTKSKEEYLNIDNKISEDYPYGLPLDGLHVIGTERHESRRIDRQLRGRAGRQGDPGTSRFYLSLEDDLMRLFGSDRIAPMLSKLGLNDDEAIMHPWMTNTVEKAQKRVEGHNFEIRKQLIKYDEVMNSQREIIYKYRRNVLKGYDLKSEILEMIKDVIISKIDEYIDPETYREDWDLEPLVYWIKVNLSVNIEVKELEQFDKLVDLEEHLIKLIFEAYEYKESQVGSEDMRDLERYTMLSVVDEQWRDHLHEMDLLKEGISLKSYGGKDPLILYKKESLVLFEGLIARIQEQVAKKVFTTYIIRNGILPDFLANARAQHNEASAFGADNISTNSPEAPTPRKIQPRKVEMKVGRNDPCPCGSGKKYKNCCGKLSKTDV